MSRLPITKTPKVYVGGAFIRSESGRTFPIRDASGAFFANIPQCTRKDLRNAVEAAAKAGPGWAKRSAFNRGQILYRLAEMMEARGVELAESITLSGVSKAEASREVAAAIERVVHYAGWTDKYEQVLGSVNPVASAHFNFTVTEPMGIIGIIAPDESPLLGLLSLILPAITSGGAVPSFEGNQILQVHTAEGIFFFLLFVGHVGAALHAAGVRRLIGGGEFRDGRIGAVGDVVDDAGNLPTVDNLLDGEVLGRQEADERIGACVLPDLLQEDLLCCGAAQAIHGASAELGNDGFKLGEAGEVGFGTLPKLIDEKAVLLRGWSILGMIGDCLKLFEP